MLPIMSYLQKMTDKNYTIVKMQLFRILKIVKKTNIKIKNLGPN